MKQKRKLLWGFLALSIAGLLLQCNKAENIPVQDTTINVGVAPVSRQEISTPIHASGMVFTEQQIRLSFKTGGIIDNITVKEGQSVKKGDRLAQLDLAEIEAQVVQARSGYDKAQRDSRRVQQLYADSVVTLEQKQNVETALQVAESNLRIAEFNLKHSVITAPSDGKILKQFVEPSEIVGPGTPVFYFGAGVEEWLVRVGVADRDIIRIQLDDPATATFDAYPEVTFPAKVTEIAQAADPQNGTFEVELALDSRGKRLAAGFVAAIDITPRKTQSYFLAPIESIVEANGSRAAVYKVDSDTVRKIPIVIGPIINDHIAVASGLEGVDQVVTVGAPYLKVGDRVTIQNSSN